MNTELAKLCTVENLQKVATNLGYSISTDIKMPNIWAIRDSNTKAGTFDDIEVLFYLNGEHWINHIFSVTTDPSDVSLMNSKNQYGTAILKEGQWKDCWKLGIHKPSNPVFKHEALIQCKSVVVIRDSNKDGILNWYDYRTPIRCDRYVDKNGNILIRRYAMINGFSKLVIVENEGIFGINNHRASKWNILDKVGPYSEGCIVHNNCKAYEDNFIGTLKKYDYADKKYSITLINKQTLLDAI